MGYLGYKPADKPLTSADITDGIITTTKIADSNITSAKITDATIVNGDIANATIALAKLSATGTPSASTFLRGDNSWVAAGGKFESALLHVRDEKSSGTEGGTFTASSWITRTLNTSLTNEISGASLASNQITLPSGTYFINASSGAFAVDGHKLKLRNTTDSTDTLIGSTEYAEYGGDSRPQSRSFVIGRFTIASSKVFEIQHRCVSTRASNGFGVSSGMSVTEVYTDVQIWKVA